MKASGRPWIWAGRLAALLVAVIIPACTGSSGGTGAARTNGILWLSPTTTGTGGSATGSAGALWVDPNSGLGGGQIGITQIIQSTDDVTYNKFNASSQPPPFNTFISYILGLEHPLSTDTSSTALTQRESTLEGMLNGFRSRGLIICLHLPNQNGGGGGGGGGGIGGIGGIAVGNQGSIPGHARGTKSARAHCKHYAYFHTGPLPGGNLNGWTQTGGRTGAPHFGPATANFEGDMLLYTEPGSSAFMVAGTILGDNALNNNPNSNLGRMGKIGVSAAIDGWCEFSYSGVRWKEAIDVYNQMIQDAPNVLQFTNWTNLATGHWRGGTQAFYWSTMYIIFPNPAF